MGKGELPKASRIDVLLALLASQRREAESIPSRDLEAFVQGTIDDEGRERVMKAAAVSPLIAGELEAIRHPCPELRAAAMRGWVRGRRSCEGGQSGEVAASRGG